MLMCGMLDIENIELILLPLALKNTILSEIFMGCKIRESLENRLLRFYICECMKSISLGRQAKKYVFVPHRPYYHLHFFKYDIIWSARMGLVNSVYQFSSEGQPIMSRHLVTTKWKQHYFCKIFFD